MPAPLLIPLAVKGLCWCATVAGFGYGCKKVHDVYKENQETKRKKADLKIQQIQVATEDNKKAQNEIDKLNQKLIELENKNKEREKEIKNVKEDLKDPNLSDKKRAELEEKLASLLVAQEDSKKEKNRLNDLIKDLGERIKKNNKIISDASDTHSVWELITMENIMIMGVCYGMYTLFKDDKGNKNS